MPSFRALCRSDSGASALEFAIVCIPFILLLFATLEVGLIYMATENLENAADHGARLIRTGQAQGKGFDATAFKNEVCKNLRAPLTCSKLQLDVRHFTSFGSSQLTQGLDAGGNLKTSFNYEPGTAGEVVVVRAFYPFDIPTLLPAAIGMGDMNGGSRLLVATVAFRNEPFK